MSDHPPGFFEGTEMPSAGWWEALWPIPTKVLEAIGLTPGMEVLDLCSGDGWFTLQIAKVARHVVAIDIDEDLLAVASARLSESKVKNCTLVAADAYDLAKHVTRPFDLVFMANAFHGVPDKLRLARAVHDVLNPAGRFAIINWQQRPREETTVLGEPRGPRTELRMSPAQTAAVVEPAGLKLVRIVEVAPYHYGAIFERTKAIPDRFDAQSRLLRHRAGHLGPGPMARNDGLGSPSLRGARRATKQSQSRILSPIQERRSILPLAPIPFHRNLL